MGDGRVGEQVDQSHHSHASVEGLSGLSQSPVIELHIGENSKGLTCHSTLLGGRVFSGVEKERVDPSLRGKGGHKSNHEAVNVGNQDDGAFVGDSILSRDSCQSSPLLQVQKHIGVGDDSMSLCVGGGAEEDPSEHGVAAIPDLSVYRRTPAELGEVGVLGLPFTHSFLENRAGGRAHSLRPVV